ncbi:MAG: SDR family NAD(P)-dependent oxidoreductase [Flavobacteriaceae bacterium]
MNNKTAFITGAAKGIGRATAVALSSSGCYVILTDIDQEALDQTKEFIEENGGKASSFVLDVSDQKQVDSVHERALKDHKRIDYFVNNAGIGGTLTPLHLMTTDDWKKVLAVDLDSVFYCLQAQIKILLPQGGGSIVNVSSIAGIKGVSYGGHYTAAKHGVLGLTKTAALEYGRHNIRVNGICPSFLETEIIEPIPDKVLDFVKNHRTPLKRLGKPEEAANAIVWLLSDKASFVNGHSLVIDGGMEAG